MRVENLKCEYIQNPIGIDTSSPRLSWELSSNERGQRQTTYRVIVASSRENAEGNKSDLWDSGEIKSDENFVFYSGKTLKSNMMYFWKVEIQDGINTYHSDISAFETAFLSENDWKGKWITKRNPKTFESNGNWMVEKFIQSYGIYFRRTFKLRSKDIYKARVYISGIGYYEIRLNGRKIGDKVLDPAQTDYSKIALYSTYDITDLLQDKNTINVVVGNGRHIKAYGYDFPKLITQIEIEYKDGKKEIIPSDENWKVSHGPLMENGIYYGEKYDFRENANWDKFDFDDLKWESAIITRGPKLSSEIMPPIRVVDTLKPVRMYSPKEGTYIYDFGQNFTGWVRMYVTGPKGTRIKLRHAEVVNLDGTLNFSTIRKAEATDSYVLKGNGVEVCEPRFTYHGFRYVEVNGFPRVPTLESVEGRVVHTDVQKVGTFYCSNDLINKIHKNTLWAQLSNLMSVPTDCPQRDERLGWTGDAQLSAEEAIYNFDMVNFYKKWLRDIQLSQKENGSLPDVVPPYNAEFFYPADPAWGTAYITIAWYLYWYYDDREVLQEHYENMKRYVEFLKVNSENNISKLGKYGDWCPPGSIFPKRTPVELTSTFYYYNDVLLLSKIADVLKKDNDKNDYSKLAEDIKGAFNRRFLTSNGYDVIRMSPIDQGTGQTSNVLPLFYDMVPQDKRQKVIQKLVDLITNDQDYHLDTGIVGTKYIFDVLAENGYADIAYKIITQDSYPGFGYMIKEGATTLWERWEKLKEGGMNSHNHVMFGSVDAWFYKYLAGLSPIVAGWKKFKVKPCIVGDLKYVSSSITTVRGKIGVSWEKTNDSLKLNLSVPDECKAELHLPILWEKYSVSESGKEIFKDGKQMGKEKDVAFVGQKADRMVFDVSSGDYKFTIKMC